ncbi:hypothetical protein MYX06_04825 [Patescibacteria group bacterium AH-259-L05]|nr:hypothetical protein [Patescibacteria group bacterium AH-259-L05]
MSDGSIKENGGRFLLLIDDPDDHAQTIPVLLFTASQNFFKIYRNRKPKQFIFIKRNRFQDPMDERLIPPRDSLIDCNSCREISLKVIRSGRCKYIRRVDDRFMSLVYSKLRFAYKIPPEIILKLRLKGLIKD